MRLTRLVLLVLLVASCANVSPTKPPASLPSPTTAPATPTVGPTVSPPAIVCGGVAESDCGPAAAAALEAVRTHGGPGRIELGPDTACLREGQTCPYPLPPENGRWVGHATVFFLDTEEVARLNVSEAGGAYEAVLIGYVEAESPSATP